MYVNRLPKCVRKQFLRIRDKKEKVENQPIHALKGKGKKTFIKSSFVT